MKDPTVHTTSQVITKRAASTANPASTPKPTRKPDSQMVTETDSNVKDQIGGSTYIRWGRTVCPETSELVYAGMC